MLKSILTIALAKFAKFNDPVYVANAFEKALKERSPFMYVASEFPFKAALTEDEYYILSSAIDITTDIIKADEVTREAILNTKQ